MYNSFEKKFKVKSSTHDSKRLRYKGQVAIPQKYNLYETPWERTNEKIIKIDY